MLKILKRLTAKEVIDADFCRLICVFECLSWS